MERVKVKAVDLVDRQTVNKREMAASAGRFPLIERGAPCRCNDVRHGQMRPPAHADIDSPGYRNPSSRKDMVSRRSIRRPSPI